MSETLVEITGLSKRYRLFHKARYRILDAFGFPVPCSSYEEVWALRGITFSVSAGQRLGIIGPNGAGKSTLLKTIAGLLHPTEGTVAVRGRVEALMELGTGFHPDFTGRQNVLAALAYRGIIGGEAHRRFEEVVRFSELGVWVDRPVSTYSAGMYARLAFSVATAINPEVLIVDEVLSAGDAYFIGKCLCKMKQLAVDSGAAVLMVSHDLKAIQTLCQRAIWLTGGVVQAEGEALEVIRQYVREVKTEEERQLRERDRTLSESMILSRGEKPLGVTSLNGYGSGEIAITGVTLSTKEQRDVRILVSLKPFEVTIEWSAYQPVSDPVFVFCIYLPSGECASQWIVSSRELREEVLVGAGRVVFKADRLLLGCGHYVASAGIYKHMPEKGVEPPAYHVLDRFLHFQIAEADVDGLDGVQHGICRQQVVAELCSGERQ